MDPMQKMGCNQVSVDINHYWVRQFCPPFVLACKQKMLDSDETLASIKVLHFVVSRLKYQTFSIQMMKLKLDGHMVVQKR